MNPIISQIGNLYSIRGNYEDLSNKTIIITGSYGHIGSFIVEWLCKLFKNMNLLLIDNNYNGNIKNLNDAEWLAYKNNNKLVWLDISYDIRYYDLMERIFKINRPQYVFHQASLLTLDSKIDKKQSIDVNIGGLNNILDLSKKYGVKKVVFASSASVYGDPSNIPTNEKHIRNINNTLYGATKIANEHIAASYADEENLKIVGLRYFNVFGERQSTRNVYTQIVPKFINWFLDKKEITFTNDGSPTMDLIHGNDVGKYNVLAMVNKKCYRNKEFEGFINIGTGVQTSVLDLCYLIKEILESKGFDCLASNITFPKIGKENFENHNFVNRRQSDTKLMNKFFGLYDFSLRDGLNRTIDCILKERKLI